MNIVLQERVAARRRPSATPPTTPLARFDSSVGRERMRLLIVDDDVPLTRMLKRALLALAPEVEPLVAHTVLAALGFLDSDIVGGLIVDMRLEDGTGVEVLQHALALRPAPCALAFSGYCLDFASKVAMLGVELKEKPLEAGELEDFARRSLARWSDERCVVVSAVNAVASGCGLSPAQATVLYYLARGSDVKRIAVLSGASVRTVEGHVAAVLARLHVHTQHGAVAHVLAEMSRKVTP